MKKYFVVLLFVSTILNAQVADSIIKIDSTIMSVKENITYKKPKLFSFFTNIPKDVAGCVKYSFQKKQTNNWLKLIGSTAILFIADQSITNTVQSNFDKANIKGTESFTPFVKINIGGKPTNFGKIPKNINTAFYNIGQGSFSMFLAAGFFVAGKIKKDNRALQTANQLTEAFIALGVGTQLIKYATGRENPSDASMIRGRWSPFTSWKNFQNKKPQYDAFPSGHLATFVTTVTIIAQNYPEVKWIKPVGYTLTGLIGLSMINNGVHWASDFPLGVALGYAFGKFISKKNRIKLIL
jgi:PAP2 superfamily